MVTHFGIFSNEQNNVSCSAALLIILCNITSHCSTQALVSAGKALVSASSSQGDISVILEVMRQLNVSVPVGADVTEKQVHQHIMTWSGQHGMMNWSKLITRAYIEFIKMRNHYCPSRPPPGVDHKTSHPMFIHVKGKSCFDQTLPNGKVRLWNGYQFGRKNPDGSPDMNCKENYEITMLMRASDHSQVIRALAHGYPNQFFVHCSELDGPVNSFSRVTDRGDGGDSASTNMRTYYTIHSKSTLSKLKQKPVVIFALTSIMFGQEMRDVEVPFRLAALNIVQSCSIDMLSTTGDIDRYVLLHPSDPLPPGVSVKTLNGCRYAHVKGCPQSVLKQEMALRRSLRVEEDVRLISGQSAGVVQKLFEEKKSQLQSNKNVFLPLVFLWKNVR